jgi:uncharacterized membrane protein
VIAIMTAAIASTSALGEARVEKAAVAPRRASLPRVESVDVLRGIVMVLMALDHVRDFFGHRAVSPTDLAHASAALFLTRWITHFCAPVFFLLTGTGAWLAMRRKSEGELSRYLVTRGVWLLFLDVVVMRCLALQWNFDFRVTILLVLWALGWSMIVLSLLVRFKPWVATTFGAVLVLAHDAFDRAPAMARGGGPGPLEMILHAPGLLFANDRFTVVVGYPLIPWIGVTALGFGLGQVFAWPPDRRRALLARLGVAFTAAFVVLRAVAVYGDPAPWSKQATPLLSVLSFLNTNKYPPSLLFLLMTLGPALLALAWLDRGTPRALAPAHVIGKVPLFYFVVHFVLIHTLAAAFCLARYGAVHWMFESPSLDKYPFAEPPGWGYDLPVVYLVWIALVVAMYPLCRWYAAVKRTSDATWLSYL